jgi:hypothetical protein
VIWEVVRQRGGRLTDLRDAVPKIFAAWALASSRRLTKLRAARSPRPAGLRVLDPALFRTTQEGMRAAVRSLDPARLKEGMTDLAGSAGHCSSWSRPRAGGAALAALPRRCTGHVVRHTSSSDGALATASSAEMVTDLSDRRTAASVRRRRRRRSIRKQVNLPN